MELGPTQKPEFTIKQENEEIKRVAVIK